MSTPQPPLPPFHEATARQKVLAAETAWNMWTFGPDRIAIWSQYEWLDGGGIPLR